MSTLTSYFLFTFLSSWVLWGIVNFGGMASNSFPGSLMYMLGGFAPSLVAIIIVQTKYSKDARKDFWKRVTNPRRIKLSWWFLSIFLIPALIALAIWIDVQLGGSVPELPGLNSMLAQPYTIPIMVFMMFIAGGLSEELGWRGLALEELQNKNSPLKASAILGPIWAAWHLPLFSLMGTTHFGWGWFSPMFFIFLTTVIVLTFFITPVYDFNRHSTLSAILVHFSFNLGLALAMPLSLLSWGLFIFLLGISTVTLWVFLLKQEKSK
jgi:CAAX protease family protein